MSPVCDFNFMSSKTNQFYPTPLILLPTVPYHRAFMYTQWLSNKVYNFKVYNSKIYTQQSLHVTKVTCNIVMTQNLYLTKYKHFIFTK